MTAVAEDLCLDWVTFAGDDESCDGTDNRPCGLEAVAVALWSARCDHNADQQRLCAAHRDQFAAAVTDGGPWFACPECLAPARLLRIEPLR